VLVSIGRRFSSPLFALALAAVLASLRGSTAAAGLLGIADGYVLYDINTATGAASNPRTVGNRCWRSPLGPRARSTRLAGFRARSRRGGAVHDHVNNGFATFVAT